MNLNTVIAGHIEKLSVRKIGPQKWGTEECSPITPLYGPISLGVLRSNNVQ